MIYDRDNIQISELCPIQFSEPKETDFYDAQLKYCGKISGSSDLVVQVLISEAMYLTPTGNTLRLFDKDNIIVHEEVFEVFTLSTGIYYAIATISKDMLIALGNDLLGYFRISNIEEQVLLADSLWYVINPSYTRDLKTLSITHSENDWNTVFLDGENQYKFYLNVECGFIPKDERDEFETDDFIEQNMTNDTVFGDMYVVEPVTFGDNIGIPNWLRRKISRWILCDEFKIDSVEYKRTNGSKLEKTDDIENGNGIYKIDMQTINNYLQ